MSKRPSSPVGNGSSGGKARAAAAGPSSQKPTAPRRKDEDGDEGMGQFEDDFEDEFEDDAENGEVIDNASDSGDMEIDGG